jgi:thioredoxin 1
LAVRRFSVAMLQLNKDNFEQTVSGEGIVLVDCWAAWCGGCKTFSPVFDKVAARHPDHVFAKLDTQSSPELVSTVGVQHIPSLLVYRDGIMLLNQPGNFEEDSLEDIVRQAESIDMDAVRADIAESQSGQEAGESGGQG